jgi:mono/diheme cytochrome c family protein
VKPRAARLAACLLALTVIVGASGCDLREADVDNGRELFVAQCGTCHQLAEAATTAETGPDLDASFSAARDAGMDSDTVKGVVAKQIANPRFTDPSDPTYMPPDLVTGRDADDVAAYVASVAGVPGVGPPVAPGGPGGQVFANNGCGACHVLAAAGSSGQTGPDLDEVIPGQDEDQVEEQIVNPDSQVTPGFEAGIMPSNYGDTISPEDLQLLVEFLVDSAGSDGNGGNGPSGRPSGNGGN